MMSQTPPVDWGELYERCAPLVHRRARSLLGDSADAWDAVQEIFRRLIESSPRLRPGTRPMTYLYQVTTNVCLNWLRDHAGKQLALPAENSGVELEAPSPAAAVEARHLILKLMGRLDERALTIATLHFHDELTQEQIAEIVQLSRKTVGLELQAIRRQVEELAS